MKRKGFAVSFSILIAAVIAIFYAAFMPIIVQTLIEHSQMILDERVIFFLGFLLSNVGAYVFVTAVPSHFLREKSLPIQFLANVLSSTVYVFGRWLYENSEIPEPEPHILENPIIAAIYIAVPFIIFAYIVIKSKKGTE